MKLDRELLERLEKNIDTDSPEDGDIPISILGYGEISLVFTIDDDPAGEIAYKRLPIFSGEEQVKSHIDAYYKYNEMLDNLGINIPEYSAEWVYMDKKNISLYCAQKKIDPASIGNKIIHQLTDDEIKQFVYLLMKDMHKVWQFNLENEDIKLGFDGQISNTALKNFSDGFKSDTELIYLDTSTPMYRINGEDAMDAVLFLKSAPPGLRFLLKIFFLKEVLDRYYDWREVTIDLIANFYKEKKSNIIPDLIEVVNNYFSNEAVIFDIKPISVKEVKKYYRSDRFIWILFQNLRRMDKFIKTKIFRKKYSFYLPSKIDR